MFGFRFFFKPMYLKKMVLAPQNGQRPFHWNVFWSPLGAGMKHTGDCATEGGLGALHTFLIPDALLPRRLNNVFLGIFFFSSTHFVFSFGRKSGVYSCLYKLTEPNHTFARSGEITYNPASPLTLVLALSCCCPILCWLSSSECKQSCASALGSAFFRFFGLCHLRFVPLMCFIFAAIDTSPPIYRNLAKCLTCSLFPDEHPGFFFALGRFSWQLLTSHCWLWRFNHNRNVYFKLES